MVTTDHGRRRGAATYRRGQAFRRRARRNVVRARTTLKTATTTEFAHTRGRLQGGRAPTRGAPTARTIWQRALVCAHERAPTRGEGTHKGRPYGPNDMATSAGLCTREGTHKGGGHPQGVPLGHRTIWQRALVCAHERAPTRGEGTHKGRPYGPERYGNERWFVHTRGHPQGGRAPTRGAPTARTICRRALVKLAAISWQALSDPRCGRRYFLESALYHPR